MFWKGRRKRKKRTVNTFSRRCRCFHCLENSKLGFLNRFSTCLAVSLVDTLISSSTSRVFMMIFIGSSMFSHSASWKIVLLFACSFARNRYR